MSLLASIPSPSANSISIGPLELNAYGMMIALGIVAAIWLMGRRLEDRQLGTADDAGAMGMWGAAAGVVGARLYHVVTDWDRFSNDLSAIPKLWQGGLGIPGGLLAGVAAGLSVGRRRGIAPMAALTCAAPAIPLAQAIGRWGNWFNQELYGRPTDLPWALEIDDAHNLDYPAGTTFHPTFLYESLWNLALVGVLLLIERRFRLGPGRLFAVYLVGYGIGRFWIEGLRIDTVQLADVFGMRWNQWVALAAVVGGSAWLAATRGATWPEPEPEPEPGSGLELGSDASAPDHADEPDRADVGRPATGEHRDTAPTADPG